MHHVTQCNDGYMFQCPHCKMHIHIAWNDVRCRIFRCGVYSDTLIPIPPHSTKEYGDRLLKQNRVYGCTRPFQMIETNGTWHVSACDYI